jgi:hypothetical protein
MAVLVKPGNSYELDGTYFLNDIFDNLVNGSGLVISNSQNASSSTNVNNAGFDSKLYLYGTNLSDHTGTVDAMTMTINAHNNLVFTGLDINFASLKAASDLPMMHSPLSSRASTGSSISPRPASAPTRSSAAAATISSSSVPAMTF